MKVYVLFVKDKVLSVHKEKIFGATSAFAASNYYSENNPNNGYPTIGEYELKEELSN